MMKKVVFFPYHPDIELLITHRHKMKGYEIVGLISYKEDEETISDLYGQLGIEKLSYEETLSNCDEIIILDNYRYYRDDKYYQVIKDAINRNISIYITPVAAQALDLTDYKDKYDILGNVCDFEGYTTELKRQRDVRGEGILCDIEIPIIAVMGMGKNCGKFELQLLTKEVLENHYATITVTANALGVLFGCYTLPNCLFEDRSAEWKIFCLNYYIKQLSEAARADVMLVEIPEGLARFEKLEANHFGEYAYVMTNALPIDMAFLCTYFFNEGVSVDSVLSVAASVQGRFNVPICGIAVSKTLIEIPDERRDIIYEHLDEMYLSENYPNLLGFENFGIIDMRKYEDAKEEILLCIQRLSDNASAI